MRTIDADVLIAKLGIGYDCFRCEKYDQPYCGWTPKAVDVCEAISDAPTIEPERKTGKWIERNPQNSDKCRLIECDQCGFSHIVGFNVPYEHWIENRNFCERCGADMREKVESDGKDT